MWFSGFSMGATGEIKKKKGPRLVYSNDDIKASVAGKIATGTGLDIFAYLLNNDVPEDKAIATKTVFDLIFNVETASTKGRFGLRSKSIWGNSKVIKTDITRIKNVDFLDDGHTHSLAPRVIWVKEAWLETDLAKVFDLGDVRQVFAIGAFPFELGRGISLGNVFSVNPTTLGFYADSLTDQYGFGAKYSTGLVLDWLTQDVYVSIA